MKNSDILYEYFLSLGLIFPINSIRNKKKIGGEKVMQVITQSQKQMLFKESLEMARYEMADKVWYNLNLQRISELILFCMDFLRTQRGWEDPENEQDDDLCNN